MTRTRKPRARRPAQSRTVADERTRQRLLEAAARLFSERGFQKITVREICRRANANVAAVNYHFRDKLGLYSEVVWMVIRAAQSTREAAIQAGEGRSTEEKLRAYLRVYLRRLLGEGQKSWIHKLLAHELADPTPAFDLIVEHAIRPRIAYLSGIVSELLGCAITDRRVSRCVASIQGQCLMYAPTLLAARLVPEWKVPPAEFDSLTEHIAAFSLAGIRVLAQQASTAKT
ncbi:MAG: CerR family C-terminal domain-containing protein [bacterium]